MAICIVVPHLKNKFQGGDTYSRFPIEVIYKLASRRDDEEDQIMRLEFWSDTPGDKEAPTKTVFRNGREWKAWRWKEHMCDWELV